MPGAMHRMGVYLGLVEDDDYADGEGWDDSTSATPSEPGRARARPPRGLRRAALHRVRPSTSRSAARSRRCSATTTDGHDEHDGLRRRPAAPATRSPRCTRARTTRRARSARRSARARR